MAAAGLSTKLPPGLTSYTYEVDIGDVCGGDLPWKGVSSTQDVTLHVQAQAALREQIDRLADALMIGRDQGIEIRATIEHLSDGMERNLRAGSHDVIGGSVAAELVQQIRQNMARDLEAALGATLQNAR